MPQTIKTKRASRRIRKGAHAGKNKTGPGRERSNGAAAKTPRILAHSLFAITLKPIPAVALVRNSQVSRQHFNHDDDDFEQMYKDLLKCMQNACKLKGIETNTDFYACGLDLSASLQCVINIFEKEILPGKTHGEFQWLYNIDKDDNGYFFTIFKYCDMQQFWHAFEIKHVVKYLARVNKPLLKLFIVFLKSFMVRTDISAWHNGALGYAEYWFDEEVEFWWDNHDKGDKDDVIAYKKALKTKRCYESGEAKKYQLLLEKSGTKTPAQLIQQLSTFSKRSRIVTWMIEACKFMQKKDSYIGRFIYEEYEGQEGLKFDQQVSVIWDWDDEYTHAQSEAMDCDANNIGVNSPCFYYHITPHTREINIDQLLDALDIPIQLSKLFDKYYDAVNPLRRNAKRKN